MNFITLAKNNFPEKAVEKSVFLRLIIRISHAVYRFTGSCPYVGCVLKVIDSLLWVTISLLMISLCFASSKMIGLLILCCFGLTVLKIFHTQDFKFLPTAIDFPVVALLTVVGLSTCFSSYFSTSLEGFSKAVIYFSIYLSFSSLIRSRVKLLKILLLILVLSSLFESLYGIYQHIVGVEALATWQDLDTIRADNMIDRIYGTLLPYNPNLLAGYIVPIVALALGTGFIFLYKKSFLLSGFFFAVFLIHAYVIYLTGCRGAYIALAAMLISAFAGIGHILFHDFKENKKLFVWWIVSSFIIVAGIVLFIMLKPALLDRIQSIFTVRENSSNSFRMNVYLAAFQMFCDNWLIGIGPGNDTFRLVYGLYMRTGFDALSAYSIYLETAVESGIVGLGMFFWLVVVVFFHAVRSLYCKIDMTYKILLVSLLTGIIGLYTHGLVDTIFFRPQIQVPYWLMIASLASITRYASQNNVQKI